MKTPEPLEPYRPRTRQPETPPAIGKMGIGDVRLADLVERSLPRARVPVEWIEPLILVARVVQRHPTIKHTELVRRLRGYRMRASTVRKMIDVLEREGLVRRRPPGFRRRAETLEYLGDHDQPITVPVGLMTSRFEREILAMLARWPGGIKHTTLLHKLSWLGLRARDLDAFVHRARRAGVLRVDVSPTGARWYQLVPGSTVSRVLEALRAVA